MTQLRAVMEAPHIAHAVRVLCAAGHDRDVSRVVLLEDAHGLVGASSDSIVVLTTDHGDSLGEDGNWGHGVTIYPEVVRIPLMIHVPERLKAITRS